MTSQAIALLLNLFFLSCAPKTLSEPSADTSTGRNLKTCSFGVCELAEPVIEVSGLQNFEKTYYNTLRKHFVERRESIHLELDNSELERIS